MKSQRVGERAIHAIVASRKYIALGVCLFLVSAAVSFLVPGPFSVFDSMLKDLVEKTLGLGPLQLIWFIFQNNVSSAFLAIVFGIFLGIVPFFNAVTNGAVLGYVLSKATEIEGFGVILRLIPHGIFELPAIFIAIGMGMHLGMFVFAHNRKQTLKERFIDAACAFFVIIVPLLVIAAVIEGLLIVYW